MAITFTSLGSAIFAPGIYQETNDSRASSGSSIKEVLILAAATGSNVPVGLTTYTTQADCEAAFGAGSDIALLAKAIRAADLSANITLAAPASITAGVPDLSAIFTAAADRQFDFVVMPWTDSATLAAINAESDRRAAPLIARPWQMISARFDTFAALSTLAAAQNSRYMTIFGLPSSAGHDALPAVLGALAGTSIAALASDPGGALLGVSVAAAPKLGAWDWTSANSLLAAGISTVSVNAAGEVSLQRVVTMNKTNTLGTNIATWKEINAVTLRILIERRIRDETNIQFLSQRYKLAASSSEFSAGVKVMTPDMYCGFLLSLYRDTFCGQLGWCQGISAYAGTLKANINADSKFRLDFSHEPTLVGQFLVAAGVAAFA